MDPMGNIGLFFPEKKKPTCFIPSPHTKDTVDGSEIRRENHLGCIKSANKWDIYHINW